MRGLFFTGVGTGVGKTHTAALAAAALAAHGVGVGVYKPVASGCRDGAAGLVSEDAELLWRAAGEPPTLEAVCPQRFAAPLAPNVAARAEGKRVDRGLLVSGARAWDGRCDLLVVEGAGGLFSPLSDDDTSADLAARLAFPLVIVAADRLGVLHDVQACLPAAEAYRSTDGRRLAIAGVVLNEPVPSDSAADPSPATNAAELRRWIGAPLLARVAFGASSADGVDWLALAAAGR